VLERIFLAFLEFEINKGLARPFSCRSAKAHPYVFFACSAVRASYRAAPLEYDEKKRGETARPKGETEGRG